VFFMLEAELTALEKLSHHFFDLGGVTLIANFLKQCPVNIVCLECKRLGLWRLRKLLEVIQPILVLLARFLKEDSIRLEIKDSVVIFI